MLIHGFLPSKFYPHLLSSKWRRIGCQIWRQQFGFGILWRIHKPWLAQTEGWYSCYLKVPFNSTGSQASLRPLLTESTQPKAALQVINTLLTVVRGLLSSEQRTASCCTNSKQSQPADLEHKALVSRSPAISPPISTIKVSYEWSQYFNVLSVNCRCFAASAWSSTSNLVLAKCVVIYWYLIRADMTKETSSISVKCRPEVTAALCA